MKQNEQDIFALDVFWNLIFNKAIFQNIQCTIKITNLKSGFVIRKYQIYS